jgi:hypothetical protein
MIPQAMLGRDVSKMSFCVARVRAAQLSFLVIQAALSKTYNGLPQRVFVPLGQCGLIRAQCFGAITLRSAL